VIRHFKRTSSKLLSPKSWKTRLVFWAGAVLVGLVAVGFAVVAEEANTIFRRLVEYSPYLPLLVSPAILILVAWLTTRYFDGSQGSGIPQAIAALELRQESSRDRLLSMRIVFGKIVLTFLGLLSGASIMYSLGRLARFPLHYLDRGLILAGGAAGIAAAFNTPLAGIVFAIEEMSRSFEERTSGTLLTAVVFAGVTAVALQGNYSYFGSTTAELPVGGAWIAVLVCGVIGGLLGGIFSQALITGTRWLVPINRRWPILVAAACGLAIAVIGLASGGTTYGTGYDEARQVVTGTGHLSDAYPYLKLAATVASYLSGIPGGIFAPSLATGAGLGAHISTFFTDVPGTAIVILAMAAYFAGVVQTPITAMVIVMEMTDNQNMLLPIMATAFIAYLVSRTVCREPIYRVLAEPFLQMESSGGKPSSSESKLIDVVPEPTLAAQPAAASSADSASGTPDAGGDEPKESRGDKPV
jgi:H+/Cl- antiporter ClcA